MLWAMYPQPGDGTSPGKRLRSVARGMAEFRTRPMTDVHVRRFRIDAPPSVPLTLVLQVTVGEAWSWIPVAWR
jgi:hypothetical protein